MTLPLPLPEIEHQIRWVWKLLMQLCGNLPHVNLVCLILKHIRWEAGIKHCTAAHKASQSLSLRTTEKKKTLACAWTSSPLDQQSLFHPSLLGLQHSFVTWGWGEHILPLDWKPNAVNQTLFADTSKAARVSNARNQSINHYYWPKLKSLLANTQYMNLEPTQNHKQEETERDNKNPPQPKKTQIFLSPYTRSVISRRPSGGLL